MSFRNDLLTHPEDALAAGLVPQTYSSSQKGREQDMAQQFLSWWGRPGSPELVPQQ